MRLTTKGRIALTAMADIAMHRGAATVPLIGISARCNISVSYLEPMFKKLRRSGLVKSVRGPCGGYRLARHAAQMTIADIVLAVDDPIYATRRGGSKKGHSAEQCIADDLWTKLNQVALGYLAAFTLEQVVEDQLVRQDRARAPQDIRNAIPARDSTESLPLPLRVEPGLPAPRTATARRLEGPVLQHGATLADSIIALAALGIVAALALLAY